MIQSEKAAKWKSDLHEAVKQAIRNSSKRQIELAEDLGISQSQVSGILHRKTGSMKFESLVAYAERMGVECYFSVDEVKPVGQEVVETN